MDHLQSASRGSGTTPSKMLTQHTGDPLGGQTYQHECSVGSQHKHCCNTNFGGPDISSACPTHVSPNRSCTPSSMMVGVAPVGRRNLFRTTSRPTCGSSVAVDDWDFIALERHLWNEVTHKGTATYESELRHVANSKRQLQREAVKGSNLITH